MLKEIKLPPLGEDAGDEAQVSFWYFEVGQQVNNDEDLVELVTDKATFDVPSPVDGRIVAVLANEGDTVAVGGVLCTMEVDGEANSDEDKGDENKEQ